MLTHPSINLDILYTADIKAFYPSTPHELILKAFDHYYPHHTLYPILEALLPLNYVTDGFSFFTLGEIGIPMGLPLAPELARMVTAFLLLDYTPPPNNMITIYFDDIASSFPIPTDLLAPYVIEPGPNNLTQDVLYDPTAQEFVQVSQNHRQPTPLSLASNHPSQKMVKSTWKSPVLRSAAICSSPHIALNNHYRRYMTHYMRAGYLLSDLAYDIADLFYFPRTTPKAPLPETTGISYHYSQTRPTISQMKPITKLDFHLVPKITIPPLITILQYSPPQRNLEHRVTICRARCQICCAYDQRFGMPSNFPFEPCAKLRIIYLLHHEYATQICYIGQTGATPTILHTPRSNHRIWAHQRQAPSLSWQVLRFLPAEYQAITRMETSLEIQMITKLSRLHPKVEFIANDPSRFYDAIANQVAPIPIASFEDFDP